MTTRTKRRLVAAFVLAYRRQRRSFNVATVDGPVEAKKHARL